ncbi:MAG: hypothetical protein R2728_13515 [Chitinophagales bacterium]
MLSAILEASHNFSKATKKNITVIRKAKMEDIPYLVKMLADDPIGKKREDFQVPLPVSYINAFENINSDPNQALMVVENDGKIIGTFQLSFIQYLYLSSAAFVRK